MIDLENRGAGDYQYNVKPAYFWLAAVRIRHKLSLAEVSKMLGISINSLK